MDAQVPNRPFTIDWNSVTESQWDSMFAKCWRTTLNQSRAHALADAATRGERAEFGVIRFHGKPVGMVTARLRTVAGFFTAASIHRGPIWIQESIPPQMLSLALAEIKRRFRLRQRRSFLLHPELTDTEPNRAAVARAGLRRVAPGYQTIWIDLRAAVDDLRAQLQATWRNKLTKAERAGLTVRSGPAADIDGLLDHHDRDRLERDYRGPSGTWIRHLRTFLPEPDFLALDAECDGAAVAGTICVRHGTAATYLIGWNGADGRRRQAHNLLLWQSMLRLREAGCTWFDLGGINDQGAAGIARFKSGMGGTPVTLVGGYR